MALDTLDPNRPLDGDALSLGDDAIRETRQAMIDSFKVEHTLAGIHTIPLGTTATRPTAGTPGRLFLNTSTGLIEVDNGSVWVANRASIPMSSISFTGTSNPGQWVNLYNTSFPSPVTIMLMGTFLMTRGTSTQPDETYVMALQTSPPAFNPPQNVEAQFQGKSGFSVSFAWTASAVTGFTLDALGSSSWSGAFSVTMNGGLVII